MDAELEQYKQTVQRQIKELSIYFAKMGINYDFYQEIMIPAEEEPLSDIYQFLSLIQDNLRDLYEANQEQVVPNRQRNRTAHLLPSKRVHRYDRDGQPTTALAMGFLSLQKEYLDWLDLSRLLRLKC